ncbi:MAG: helix-turn-helix domain-containing protein, partial [Clostridia bacterium]
QSFVKELLNENQPVEVVVDKIITEVCKTFSVSVDDIKSRKKSANISNARQMCIYIIKDITPLTMKEIGKYFGGKDHTTIVYTIQKVSKQLNESAQFAAMINDIIKNVKES